jgi:ribonucleoside-diphosphate reductase alpha chain
VGNTYVPTIKDSIAAYLEELTHFFPQLEFGSYREKVGQALLYRQGMTEEQVSNLLILSALERISVEEPDWTYVAAKVYLDQLYRKAATSRGYDDREKYGSLYELIRSLTNIGIYSDNLLNEYTKNEIDHLQQIIVPERDHLFTYIGLMTLADRYLAKSHSGDIYELPQERFLIIAMTLMMKEEKEKRLELIKEAYWALSNLYMTVATPTLANAGKSYGQLSSCFIDTVDDSLRGIYDSNTDIATVSKNGGGIN